MSFAEFQKTEKYQLSSDPMKVVYAMQVFDQYSEGMSFSRLNDKLGGDLSEEDISAGIEVLMTMFKVNSTYKVDGNRVIMVYRLEPVFKDTSGQLLDIVG